MNVVVEGRRTSEYWTEKSFNSMWYRSRYRRKPEGPVSIPTPSECESSDGDWRIVDLVATTEAFQTRRKKQYEKDRAQNSSGENVRVPRCPLAGAAKNLRQRRSRNTASPILFTIPNLWTPEDCASYIAEASPFFHHQDDVNNFGWRGGYDFMNKRQPAPYWCTQWWERKAQSCLFSRTNAYCRNVDVPWTSKLKAVFEGIILEGHEAMCPVGVSSWNMMHRYEKGEKCERHNSDFTNIHGYDVLLYLNGGREDESSRVVGGESVFYPQHYVNSKSMRSHIAKVAPETGLAVCVAIGERSPLTEIRAVTEGVMYMLEFRVLFAAPPATGPNPSSSGEGKGPPRVRPRAKRGSRGKRATPLQLLGEETRARFREQQQRSTEVHHSCSHKRVEEQVRN